MPLQSDDLSLIALGVQNDVPPVNIQPPLVNAIHLRWAFPRARGFPWFGYYLFRRLHQMRGTRCLAARLRGRPVGSTGSPSLVTPDGTFSSDANISLTDNFPAAGDVEVDLLNRSYLMFEVPAGESAYRVDVRIGFRASGSVDVSAYDREMLVASSKLTRAGGDANQQTARLEFDRITSVRITGANAAVIELCWYPVSAGVTQDWAPAPQLIQPITLPLTHPDYPAARGAVSLSLAEAKGLARIVYGSRAMWGGTPFASLHEQLILLVQGGPPGPPEKAMAHPSRAVSNVVGEPEPFVAGVKSPSIPSIHPLDLVLLSAVHAPFAQMLGLYHADTMAAPGVGYDYLLIADHTGIAAGSVGQMQTLIASGDFTKVDARIVFNQQMAPAQPLDQPAGVRVYALPAGTYRSPAGPDAPAIDAEGSVGLLWDLPPRTPQGKLVEGAPVMYHVWRDRQANGNNPAPSAEAGELVTTGGPLLITNPISAPTEEPQYSQDRPPFALRSIDFALSEGWYGYQVNSIDLFGRYSPKSVFAEWRQWAPRPNPKPWYYIDPPADRQAHPSSVRLLDKAPPPPPAAVEAWALDPQDPMVVADTLYTSWRQSLPAAQRNQLVGLRVRWRWRVAQQRQAPDTTEFRVYFHPGTLLPGAWESPASWQTRCFVCAYGSHFATDTNGNRSYEVFIPMPNNAGPFANGIPLSVDLANPIAYANVTVTAADDTAHTPDAWSETGALGSREGNESRAAAPQKIFRVLRERPSPPPPVVDSPRVYATPADWHGRSFHTFRWTPQPNLNVHVLRALDESVFAADWMARPRQNPLLPADSQYFPNPTAEPTWTNAKRQQVCDALNPFNNFPRTAAGKRSALAAYRALSDDALRVLAGLPGCEKAFTQITVAPLIAAEHPDRRGPDDAGNYTQRAQVRSWLDTLDGRCANRYLYRAVAVDAAQNRSAPGPCGTPVRLPNVTPPRSPVITRIIAGDREIALGWASNREPDLLEYRVYRADSPEAARDLRLMEMVGTIAADRDPALRPATVQWMDTPAPGLIDYWYRVSAVDRPDPDDPRGRGGNLSPPSPAVKARALQPPPQPPVLQSPVLNAAGNQLALTWSLSDPELQPRVERRIDEAGVWAPVTAWLQTGAVTTTGPLPAASTWQYRIRVRDHAGQQSASDPQPAP